MTEISNAEFEVLAALWQNHPASANDIIAKLNDSANDSGSVDKNQDKQWHEKTVKTLLNRLVKKQAISFEKQQRHYIYSPLLERETYTQNESKSLIERMFSGKLAPLVAGFAKQNELNKDDISALKSLISDWEKNND
ncbi:CopY family transcriptional repressor [Colwellia sp. MT41]|uniref:BlaI family transcriptional regulator n=1 Tax=Colwellia marinimaniae TaxID=1513592 RepID=A0ABQ0MTA9_9GAMM|nr:MULTISPECIES: BlaI/MecI/CopY family transcriptional regulator [Colwellia]ALO33934.1 CopY family transcriptional repressor [Colwellia sp. MT41]GAW95609.1 BlaI family transcriptional regulator [Colwellia marinimaniae]